MFPSFQKNNDLVLYSTHEFAFRMNPHNLHRYYGVKSVQYQQWGGIVFCPLNFVFSPGVFSLFRLFAWRLFVISSFRLASFRYFVFSPGVFSLFRLFAWRFFVISSFRVASFRYFVFSRGVFSSFRLAFWRGEKTK